MAVNKPHHETSSKMIRTEFVDNISKNFDWIKAIYKSIYLNKARKNPPL